MAAISATVSAGHIQRDVNPKIEIVNTHFCKISKILGSYLHANFAKISETSSHETLEGYMVVAIEEKPMEALVKEAISHAAKHTKKTEEFITAAKAVHQYYNRRLQATFCSEEIDEEDLEDPNFISTNWVMSHFDTSHQNMMQTFAEKVIPLSKAWQEMSCFEYAFRRIGETRINDENSPLFDLLKEWGYTSVEEPQNGDYVVFLNEGDPAHAGIYRGNGLIESKWGDEFRSAFLHRLENTPAAYGTQVLYFRPPSNP